MPLAMDDVVSQAPECLSADVQDELVVMSVSRGEYVALDSIGKDIWQRLATPCRIDALCEALAEEYDAPRATIESDVLEFLERLLGAETLVVTN
jgi:hypothetical protein